MPRSCSATRALEVPFAARHSSSVEERSLVVSAAVRDIDPCPYIWCADSHLGDDGITSLSIRELPLAIPTNIIASERLVGRNLFGICISECRLLAANGR